MIRRVMMPIFLILSALALCGCENKSVPADTSAAETAVSTSAAGSETEVTDDPADAKPPSGRYAVTFAPAETEAKVRADNESAETKPVFDIPDEDSLAENQLAYTGKSFYLLMEFTGAEPIKYYPRAVLPSKYRGDEYVLHSKFTVTNFSEKSFDFIPQKIILYGKHKKKDGVMMPISARDTGLAASDGYYTVEAGNTVSFDVDFVGKEVCIDYAYKILYTGEGIREPNNVDPDSLNNVSAAKFEITKRIKVKNAVKAARNFQSKNASNPMALTPRAGEYSVLTNKNSCCFTAEPVADGRYLRISLRIQCLTGEPEVFDPRKFKLYKTAEDDCYVYRWSFDPLLARDAPEIKNDLEGVSETLYDTPWELYVRADGTAEYTMYFFCGSLGSDEFYKFSYEGENDVFECML